LRSTARESRWRTTSLEDTSIGSVPLKWRMPQWSGTGRCHRVGPGSCRPVGSRFRAAGQGAAAGLDGGDDLGGGGGIRRPGRQISAIKSPARARRVRFREVLDASPVGNQEPRHPGLPDHGLRQVDRVYPRRSGRSVPQTIVQKCICCVIRFKYTSKKDWTAVARGLRCSVHCALGVRRAGCLR
jgi:hypothetical protein